MKNIVVFSAHPDDETLGMGGTILKHKEAGDKLYWIIATDMFPEQGYSSDQISIRDAEIEKAKKELGFENVFHLNFPTMTLSSLSLITMVPLISEIFQKTKPEIIYCVNHSDAHSDHRILFDAVMACTKSFRYPYVKKVLLYECLSETEFTPALSFKTFTPNYFVDISSQFEFKKNILNIYQSEMGEHPFPRSIKNIEALATYRGATAGVQFAEAFQLILEIDK